MQKGNLFGLKIEVSKAAYKDKTKSPITIVPLAYEGVHVLKSFQM